MTADCNVSQQTAERTEDGYTTDGTGQTDAGWSAHNKRKNVAQSLDSANVIQSQPQDHMAHGGAFDVQPFLRLGNTNVPRRRLTVRAGAVAGPEPHYGSEDLRGRERAARSGDGGVSAHGGGEIRRGAFALANYR